MVPIETDLTYLKGVNIRGLVTSACPTAGGFNVFNEVTGFRFMSKISLTTQH